MSTRSMTVLESDRHVRINLYRHMDGYPAYAGKALAEAISPNAQAWRTAASAASILLAEKYEPSTYQPEPRGVYELADWGPEDQGDLEHVYHAELIDGAGWRVTHYARPDAAWTAEWDDYTGWPKTTYMSEHFAQFCNQERAEYEARAAAYHATHGLRAVK